MYPIALNLAEISIALIGSQAAAEKRFNALIQHGAKKLQRFLAEDELPKISELQNFQMIFIVDIDAHKAASLAQELRKIGKLVNVEDQPEDCDFYFASFFSHGNFGISVHTNGKSPALGSVLRDYLAKAFPEIWEERLDSIYKLRHKLRAEKFSHAEIRKETEKFIKENSWLPLPEGERV